MYSTLLSRLPDMVPFRTHESIERETGVQFQLRLGANENLWGPSASVKATLVDLAEEMHKYSDPEGYHLRHALALQNHCQPENVVLGEGIDGLLGLFVRGFIDPGDAVITSRGTYPTFSYHVRGFGGALIEVPYQGDFPDLNGLIDAAHKHHAKIVYLSNPDNPSGSFLAKALMESFAQQLPNDCWLLLDEAYADFVEDTLLPQVDLDTQNIIRFRTFSKAYGLAGMRIGYALGSAKALRRLNNIRLHFGVNMAGQMLALAALKDQQHKKWIISQTREACEDYYKMAAMMGIRAIPSSTNFVAMDVGSVARSEALLAALLKRNVFIRRPDTGDLAHCVRISVAPKADRQALCRLLEQALSDIERSHYEAAR